MDTELSAAEANRRFYSTRAEEYDKNEECLVRPEQQARFVAAIARAVSLVRPDPAVLDACGGSGNAGMALSRHGVVPVVVDVSAEMTSIWARKASALGAVDPEIHLRPVEDFLRDDDRQWDLITFCSALHHLEDPEALLLQAAGRLAPGGVIFTMFDPTRATTSLRALRKVDWLGYLATHHPVEFARLAVAFVKRRVSSRGEGTGSGDHVGRLAERHAYGGVDDQRIVERLREAGLEVRVHERYVEGRLSIVRRMLVRLGRPSHFHLVVQRPA